VAQARAKYGISERWACRLLRQWRGTQRYSPLRRVDEDELTAAIIALAGNYGRYGYRRVTALLQQGGWLVGKDRVQRIWQREGLKVPQRQRPRGRLWLNDGSCVRLRPERPRHVWSYDFVAALTHDGRKLKILTLIDEYTRECLALRVERRLGSNEVIETLAAAMTTHGIPEHLRSDNELSKKARAGEGRTTAMARGASKWGYDCAMVGQTMRRRGSLRVGAPSRVRSPSSPADAALDRRRHYG
jgi:hypothetical protein